MKKIFITLFAVCSLFVNAQETFITNGSKNNIHNFYAFKNATIFKDYQTKIEKGVLLIKDGKVIAVGEEAKVKIPKNTVVYDLNGKFIYPSLIDLYADYGVPAAEKSKTPNFGPQYESNRKGAYNWNEAIHPEVESGLLFAVDNKKAEELRNLGFGVVLTHQHDGIIRGTSSLVTLADDLANQVMLNDKTAMHLSFDKGTSRQDYPGSLMGSIALLRQTYYDVDWYFNNKNLPEYNISLAKMVENWELPSIFETRDKLDILRADLIGDEFEMQYIFKGNGDEYERINEIKATEGRLILPINFPDAYDVSDPYNAMVVPFKDIKAWELAPYNLGIIEKNEIDFSITAADLKDKKTFWPNLRKAIKNGLSEEAALKALTYSPAEFIKMNDQVGSLNKDMWANFIITSENLFSEKNIIYENWIKGKKYMLKDYSLVDIRGDYHLKINEKVYDLNVKGEIEKPEGTIEIITKSDTAKADTTAITVNLTFQANNISVSFNPNDDLDSATIRLSGYVNHNAVVWEGNGQLSNGDWISWSAIKGEHHKEDKKSEQSGDSALDAETNKTDSLIVPNIYFPNMAYGLDSVPAAVTLLIKNVTVWTNEDEGILKNTDVLLKDGKIAQIGKNLLVEGATIIDGSRKHLTAGIIDEHSHIAISRGVNECTQAVTAEVSIADVVDCDDINIYRQLAGGVVASQLLHGSCNPIGGQSAIIKLKWGSSPEEMKIKETDGYIKFALGENVKQSNWGPFNRSRFPQTRMGVEQVYYDAFIRAKEYQDVWDKYAALPVKTKANSYAPRIDLEMETLNEILNKERFISCHSYQQSEINMLMHVGDSMGFTVNTFTHILEGYKVADKMKKHGAGGATFSDWWAYKFEVNDAIPYNGAIMHKQGIVTAFNSDDAEMGRRLNQEAAKAVKYGGVSEEEAWKFVTLNPAKLLHLDDKMGSIKVGKDADVVLWSDNPLSVYATVEKTIIEGAVYFDRQMDEALQKRNREEKAKIIEKMIGVKAKGGKTQKPKAKYNKTYHCDTVGE
ncbi:MAG: amidohydrolase family protein [Flavobacteriales bacterium]|nr:amidohydrolase family protein [Flavobacteriales bacterium]MCB9363764.1 amidohydrolase family protein [Flavobacteriales bacterium]